MDYQEAADRLEAFAICTETVPVGCEQCPAYKEGEDREKQQQACNEMTEPGKLEEAIEVIREYKKKQAAAAPVNVSN